MNGWLEDAMGEEFRFLHEQRMRLALGQARRAAEEGEVPVGAVIYDAAGQLVGKAWNQTRTLKDPTAHAEVLAITQAAAAADGAVAVETPAVPMEEEAAVTVFPATAETLARQAVRLRAEAAVLPAVPASLSSHTRDWRS